MAELKTDTLYKALGLSTPTEVYDRMDQNGELVAYTNGIFHMRALDNNATPPRVRPTFYPKGSIPPDWVVSITTGHEWIGTVDGRPKDDEQRRKMEALEKDTLNKYFFTATSYECATMLIGCLYYGQIVKKMFLLLGKAGNNGKSQLVRMIKHGLGGYVGVLHKGVLVKRKFKDDDPNKPNPILCAIRNLRAVFVTETDISDEVDPKPFKEITGGDGQTMRNLYGRVVEAVLKPIIVWVSQYAPKHDGSDGALVKRLDYSVECSAYFGTDVPKDNFEKGQFVGSDPGSFAARLKTEREYISLLFMSYAIKFAEIDLKLPAAPESEASRAVQEAASQDHFYAWFSKAYVSTVCEYNRDRIDWEKHGVDGLTRLQDVVDRFNSESTLRITNKQAKTILVDKGVYVGQIKISKKILAEMEKKVGKGDAVAKSCGEALRVRPAPAAREAPEIAFEDE